MARKYLDDAPSREIILNDINSYKTRWEKRIDENGNIFEIPISYRDTSVKTVPWNTNRQTRKRNTKPIVKKQKSTRYKSDKKQIYTPSSSSEGTTYEVQRGDTLGDILRRHGISTDAKTINRIARENGIADANKIYVGQKLNLGKTKSSKTESTSTSGETSKDTSKTTPKATPKTTSSTSSSSSSSTPKTSSSSSSSPSTDSSSSSPSVQQKRSRRRDLDISEIHNTGIYYDSSSSPSKTSTGSKNNTSNKTNTNTPKSYAGRDFLANSGAYNFVNPYSKDATSGREDTRRLFSTYSATPQQLFSYNAFSDMTPDERIAYNKAYGNSIETINNLKSRLKLPDQIVRAQDFDRGKYMAKHREEAARLISNGITLSNLWNAADNFLQGIGINKLDEDPTITGNPPAAGFDPKTFGRDLIRVAKINEAMRGPLRDLSYMEPIVQSKPIIIGGQTKGLLKQPYMSEGATNMYSRLVDRSIFPNRARTLRYTPSITPRNIASTKPANSSTPISSGSGGTSKAPVRASKGKYTNKSGNRHKEFGGLIPII